jgi:hypothetical protein
MRPLRQILSTASPLADLLDRRARELAVLQQVRKSLPTALAAQVGVADSRPPELILSAGSGAAAGLVRQRLPVLLKILQGAGWEFTGIQVRVQARSRWGPLQKTNEKQLDNISAATLLARAGCIADPELAAALRRLAAHGGQAASAATHESLNGIKNQNREQQKDRVHGDLADEPQVPPVTLKQVESGGNGNDRKGKR